MLEETQLGGAPAMGPNFLGFVLDPTKCSDLSLEEKRDLVHEISRWADNAPEILQYFSRRDLIQLICAELGKERKYSGVTKPKMIKHLLRLVAEKNGKIDDIADLSPDSLKNQNGIKKKRKKEILVQFTNDVVPACSHISKTEQVDIVICQNLACRATLTPGDKYCKRCCCCICHLYDDNKDPSVWLVCTSDPPYCGDSCGMSCHLKCALENEKAGITQNGCYRKLDGSFYCVCCGKVNWLIGMTDIQLEYNNQGKGIDPENNGIIFTQNTKDECLSFITAAKLVVCVSFFLGSWRKQLQIAKEARRVDILCDRLSLSHKILKGTELYKELHNIVNEAVKKLKKELGPLDKVTAGMARGIVNRLACGAEVQKLCASAVEALDAMLSGTFNGLVDTADLKTPGIAGPPTFKIQFEDISPTSVIVSLQFRDEVFEETIIGCTLWHRSADSMDYVQKPTFIILRPETKFKISGLTPSTEYYFKASPFSSTKELGKWEARCVTCNLNCISKKEQELVDQPATVEADSQRGSTNTSDDNQAPNLANEAALMDTPSNPSRTNTCSPDSGNKEAVAERRYEYCVKVVRWLECEGYMEKEFRVKFLTWFSLKSTAQERRVVSAFIDVLIDEPDSLVAQLADAFMDVICNKKPAFRRVFCTSLWH